VSDLITPSILDIKADIEYWWKQFTIKLEVPLSELFPEPEKGWVKHIWKHGSADLCVFHSNKLICIIEAHGHHHFSNKKQIMNDKRKAKLCQINNIGCLQVANSVRDTIARRKWRRLLGKYIWNDCVKCSTV